MVSVPRLLVARASRGSTSIARVRRRKRNDELFVTSLKQLQARDVIDKVLVYDREAAFRP